MENGFHFFTCSYVLIFNIKSKSNLRLGSSIEDMFVLHRKAFSGHIQENGINLNSLLVSVDIESADQVH